MLIVSRDLFEITSDGGRIPSPRRMLRDTDDAEGEVAARMDVAVIGEVDFGRGISGSRFATAGRRA